VFFAGTGILPLALLAIHGRDIPQRTPEEKEGRCF
jgi:hypothetical protein